MDPISSINKVYSLLIQEERQRNVGSYVAPRGIHFFGCKVIFMTQEPEELEG